MESLVTHSRLLEVLDYEQETGQFTWKVRIGGRTKVGSIAGNEIKVTNGRTYRQIRINGRNYYAHTLARFYVTGVWPLEIVNHRDGDGLNNSYANLRAATYGEKNQTVFRANKNNKAGLRGVRFDRGRYLAFISVDRESIYLGSFETGEAAHLAYLFAKYELHPFATSGVAG